MPHQCIHCGKLIKAGSKELFDGCEKCGGKFFFYISEEIFEKKKRDIELPVEFQKLDKKKVEEEVRDILKIEDED